MPGFPCRATVLPMSAGSTGHTSHGSPWRLNTSHLRHNMSYEDERAHRHADLDIICWYLLSFIPCWSSWPLRNSTVKYSRISAQFEYFVLESYAYITEYASVFKRVSHWISWESIFSHGSRISLLTQINVSKNHPFFKTFNPFWGFFWFMARHFLNPQKNHAILWLKWNINNKNTQIAFPMFFTCLNSKCIDCTCNYHLGWN